MRLIGELKHGKYTSDIENVHPDVLQHYAEAEGEYFLSFN